MANVIVAGATGATGRALMQLLLNNPSIAHIYLVHYRKTGFSHHQKVTEIIHQFDDLSTLNIDSDIDCAYCCLGTTKKKAGSLEAFRKVDKDYIVNFGHWVAQHDISQLHVISSASANPNSFSSYLQTKGETEQALGQLNIANLYLYQPSLLHGERDEFRLAERLAYLPLSCISALPVAFCKKQKPIAINQLANAMYVKSISPTSNVANTPQTKVISSLEIQKY